MAGRGPAPKDPAKRRRRNKDPIPAITIADDGQARGPELPDGYNWHEQTLKWWDTWRRSPQAQTFTDTDWDFLIDTALLHSSFWYGNAKAASELRLRAAKFGATPEDRARLRLQVTDLDAEPGGPKRRRAASAGRYAHLRVVPEE